MPKLTSPNNEWKYITNITKIIENNGQDHGNIENYIILQNIWVFGGLLYFVNAK